MKQAGPAVLDAGLALLEGHPTAGKYAKAARAPVAAALKAPEDVQNRAEGLFRIVHQVMVNHEELVQCEEEDPNYKLLLAEERRLLDKLCEEA